MQFDFKTYILTIAGKIAMRKTLCEERCRLQNALAEAALDYMRAMFEQYSQVVSQVVESHADFRKLDARIAETFQIREQAKESVFNHVRWHGC